MPTYTFKSKNTDEEWEEAMKVSELEKYREDNDCTIVIKSVGYINRNSDGKDLYSRSDSDFRDRMKNLKKTYKRNKAVQDNLKDW
jgi:hypothetical protein